MASSSTYEEIIESKLISSILLAVAGLFLGLGIMGLAFDIFEDGGLMGGFYLLLSLAMFFLGFQFRFLRIRLSPSECLIRWGHTKRKIDPTKVVKVEEEGASLVRFGGAGIRLTRLHGNWAIGYITPNLPRVAVEVSEGFYKLVVFSTQNPDEVIAWFDQWSGAKER